MKTKAILIVTLLVAIALDCLAYIAKPADLTPTIKWEITDDGVLRIYGTGEIPDVDYYKEKPKFWRQKKYFSLIKRIEIGEGITKIGSGNFTSRDGNIDKVPISLPSTLKDLNLWGAILTLEDSRLPNGLKSISDMWVIPPDGKLIIPASVKTLGRNCFPSDAREIIIEGTPDLSHNCFWSLHKDNPRTKVIFKNPRVNIKPLCYESRNGLDASYRLKDTTWKATLILPKGCTNYLWGDRLKDHYTVITQEMIEAQEKELAAMEADKNVNGYIANRLESWSDYIGKKKLPDLVKESEARSSIQRSMETWQKKGEYETSAEWQNRVNEKSRKEKLQELTAEWNQKAKSATERYNQTVLDFQKEYEAKREALRKEFYIELTKNAILEYREDTYSLKPYDADNQTFLITTKHHGDILLNVPRSDAPGFKQNWNSIVKNIDFAFLPASDSEVGLSRIIFPYNGKEYSYDGKTQTAYKVTDPNYAFTPLEVTGLKLQDVEVAALEAPSQTGKVLTQQTPASTKKQEKSLADIDRDIPTGNVKRDKTFAFIIANENYTRIDPVTYALNDGESMRQYCERTLGIPAKNITYVADASLNDMRYQLKRIGDICSAFGDEASVLVYYAGHGVPEEGTSDAYLLPVDGYAENVKTGLSLKETVETLSALPASNVTLLLDACFSGTGREGKALYAARGVALRPKAVAPKGNLVIFSASQGVESALPYRDKQHGLFTYFLLKKLKETKGQVKLGDLTEYVTDNVKRTSVVEGKMQTPTVNASAEKEDWREKSL